MIKINRENIQWYESQVPGWTITIDAKTKKNYIQLRNQILQGQRLIEYIQRMKDTKEYISHWEIEKILSRTKVKDKRVLQTDIT